MRVAVLIGMSVGMGVCAARADTITAVSTAAGFGANDQVSWSQLGSGVGGYFTAVSDNGFAVNGAFANAEHYTTAGSFKNVGAVDGTNLDTTSNFYYPGGPVTFSLPVGSDRVGATIGNSAASRFKMTFSATLTLFDSTMQQIGSVSGSADDNGDPFFLGAIDTSGQNIAAFTYSVTSIGSPAHLTAPTFYQFVYDAQFGYQDPASCASLHKSDFSGTSIQALDNDVKCPQTAFANGTSVNGLTVSPDQFAAIKNDFNPYIVHYGTDSHTVGGIVDTDPNGLNLQSFSVSALQLKIPGTPKVKATANACVATKPANL